MSLIIREMQIKTTVRYCFTLFRTATVKKQKQSQKIASVGDDEERLGSRVNCWEECKIVKVHI